MVQIVGGKFLIEGFQKRMDKIQTPKKSQPFDLIGSSDIPWYKEIYYFFWRFWNYHLSPRSLYRSLKHFFQYITRGYSDRQIWSLDYTIAEFVVPRLRTLKKQTHGYALDFKTMEEWHEAVDKMIWSFEFVLSGYGVSDFDSKDPKEWAKKNDARTKKYTEGMELFAKYYWNLWD